MHSLTPEQIRYAKLYFGKFNTAVPDFSGIKPNDKFYAHMKHGGDVVLVDVEARGSVYMLECWTDTGKPRRVPIIEIWGYDCGDTIINANELRVVSF